MILNEAINRTVRLVIDSSLGIPGYSIRATQPNAPRPTEPYAAVNVLSVKALGWDENNYICNDGDDKLVSRISGLREAMVSVEFFRLNAIDNALSFHTRLLRETTQATLRSLGLSFTRRTDVRHISLAFENTWEERAQLDVFLNLVASDSEFINHIETVDIGWVYQINGLNYNFNTR